MVSSPPDAPGDTYLLGDLPVHRVGYGAMQLPGPGVFGPPRDRDAAVAVLRRARELGVDHVDTAQYYGPDVANELIREALHPYPDDLVLVSKVGARRDDRGTWLPAQTPAELRAGVEDNLRTLGTERLGAVNLRLHGGPDDAEVSLDDQLGEMVALREEGKIAAVGLSNASLDQVEHALEVAAIGCVQNAFSLVEQDDRATLERCVTAGVAYVPFFPLGSAFPGRARVTDHPGVRQVAEKHAATPAQVGLAWLMAQGPHVLLIPGTTSLTHLEQNVAAGALTLDADDLAALAA